MSPKEKLGEFALNSVYQIDCLEAMKKIPNRSVDLIITDPPYGDNCSYGRWNKKIANNQHPLINCLALFEFQRILKNNSVVYNFTSWKHYPFLTEFVMRYTCFKIRHMVVCNKKGMKLGYGFRNKHELILVLEKGKGKYHLKDFANVIDFDTITHTKTSHPHKKPEKIIARLIHHSSKEGDIVLDPFLGEGTTAVACKRLNRNFLGFEIDKDYFTQACRKIAEI